MRPHTALATLLLAAPALAQVEFGVPPFARINIDFGDAAGTPSAAYSTHAGVDGVWNTVPHDATDFPLVLSDGTPSSATITISGGGAFAFDHPGTTGDDQALLDDGSRSAGTQTITIHNAFAKTIYAHAWSPDSAATFTEVSMGLGGQDVGGAWTGAQAWQTTYEVVSNCDFWVDDLVVEVRPSRGSAFGTINGLQINGPGTGCTFCNGEFDTCPCDNPGFPDAGCDNAQGTGGVRLSLLAQTTSPNGITLLGTGFPTTTSPAAVVLRNSLVNATPFPFGDGLLCLQAGGLRRLGATTAVGGASTHAFGHSAKAGPGLFYYQVWYRNTPASFCTSSPFNLSEALGTSW